MAYEVTATRRRPQDFDSLVGQEFVAATLKNAIQSGKIAHAYLFSGPRGCGKTSSARILAKALNCQRGPAAQPCGQCPACQEITRGASLDVIEIDGASNTSVNDIRQMKSTCSPPVPSMHCSKPSRSRRPTSSSSLPLRSSTRCLPPSRVDANSSISVWWRWSS